MAPPGEKNYPMWGFVLTLIGGILILIDGLYTAIIYAIFGSIISSFFPGLGALFIALGIVALFFGLIIIIGAIRMRTAPQSAKMWGILVIVFALLSWVGGAGFFLGFILALIGGILALVWKPPMMAQPAWGQPAAPMPGAPPAAAPASGQKFCGSCGSPNPAGAQTCSKCGAPLPA